MTRLFVLVIKIIFAIIKFLKMKRIIFTILTALTFTVLLSSCGSARKTGCPNNQGIIH